MTSSITKGRYIVIEGVEGAGKTTAIRSVKRFLTERAVDYIIAREPGATKVGESIRNILKTPNISEPLDARTELLLFYAARIELLAHIIKPALEKGTWVLSDRFELSSFAYQGGGRKIDSSVIQVLSNFCVGDLQPDLIIFLDVPPAIGLERARARGKLDRIEQESIDFFMDVYNAYHLHLKKYDNVAIIDASLPISVVQRLIREKLDAAISTYA